VGWAYAAGNAATHAFLYSNGAMSDLGTLGGAGSWASGINSNGQVVGYSATAGNAATHAFLYSNGAMSDLGTLGGVGSWATGINNNGQVVGYSATAGNAAEHAFLYSGGSMLDLNNLLSPGLGWMLSEARGINDLGQIVGTGTINGQYHAFLMTPVAVAGCPNAPNYVYPNDTGALGLYEGQIKDTRISPNAPTIVTYNISQTELYNIPILSAILGKRNSLWASVVNIHTDPGITLTPNADDPLGGGFAAFNVVPANGYVSYNVSFCNRGKAQLELKFDIAAHTMTGIDLLMSAVPIASLFSPTTALALRDDLIQIPLVSSTLLHLSNGFDLLFKGRGGAGWQEIQAGLSDYRHLLGGARLGADPAVSEQYLQFVKVLGKYGLKTGVKDLTKGLTRALKYAADVAVIEIQTNGYRDKILLELIAP